MPSPDPSRLREGGRRKCRRAISNLGRASYIPKMTATDPRSFLYRDTLDPDAALRLTANALSRADDGELYLQYKRSEAFGFDDGRPGKSSISCLTHMMMRVSSHELLRVRPRAHRLLRRAWPIF